MSSPTIVASKRSRGVRTCLAVFAAGLALLASKPAFSEVTQLDPAEARFLAREETAPAPDLPSGEFLYGNGEPERLRDLRRGFTSDIPTGEGLRIRALEGFLDYDDEQQLLYGPGRTQIVSEDMFLEADRLILDNRLREIQAEGNVILRFLGDQATADDELRADALRYNFGEGEGVAFGAEGSAGPMFFRSRPPSEDDLPGLAPLQQVSRNQSIFRHTEFTTCDFKVPHYFIRANEIIIVAGDRIFFRKAAVYVGGVPVLYLPFYTRSLVGANPWSIQLGSGGRTGTRVRVGYQFEHRVSEPSFEDDEVYVDRSGGQARWFADFLSRRGLGGGMEYDYFFDFERHRGRLQAYAIQDTDRKVDGNKATSNPELHNESERWQLLWRHRTEVTENLIATIDIDAFSDPEIFFDILDRFADDDDERERQIVRRGRAALTYVREAYVARLLVEVKDRAGIDQFNDFSDPRHNDRDFDFDPGETLRDSDSDGIAKSRWGRVTQRAPQFTFATRYLPVTDRPIYVLKEISIYNNLDKGLNVVDEDDDAWVRGIEFYDQVLWQHHLTERYILLAKIGVGAGAAQRDNDDLGINVANLPAGPIPGTMIAPGGLLLTDTDGTFLVGTETYNLDDIETFYVWFDAELGIHARFSDALRGKLVWQFRETTDDFIGDFYASIGDITSREDLYAYRLRQHWVSGELVYTLVDPDVRLYAQARINLKSKSDLFPNEHLYNWATGVDWTNRPGTLDAMFEVSGSAFQAFHPSDTREGERKSVQTQAEVNYSPRHKRWFAGVRVSNRSVSGTTSEVSGRLTLFSEDDNRTRARFVYGRELGPKWDSEIEVRTDSRVSGLREVRLRLRRDFHDAYATLDIRRSTDARRADDRKDNPTDFDIALGLTMKLPDQDIAFGPGSISTLDRPRKTPAIAY